VRRLREVLHLVAWCLLCLVLVSAALIVVLNTSVTSWASRHTAVDAVGAHNQISGAVPVPCLLWFLVIGAMLLLPLIATGALHRPERA
jgi:uncharacterized membrane protein